MKNKISLYLIIGKAMLIGAIVFVSFALNNPQASFPWSNTITYGIYIIYAIASVFFIIIGLINKNGTEEIHLQFRELEKRRNIVVCALLLVLLTIPLYSRIYHTFLYYIIVILVFVPFAFYRIMRNDLLE